MSEADENLVRFVYLHTLERSQVILLEALAQVLRTIPMDRRVLFLQLLSDEIQKSLQSEGEDYSGQAQLLGMLIRGLREIVLDES